MSTPKEHMEDEVVDPEINISVKMKDFNRAKSKRYMIEDLRESEIDLHWKRELDLEPESDED